jgi:hypothetical protein
MALFDRLVGYTNGGAAPLPEGEAKLGIHAFVGGLAELARGSVTRAQVIAAFGIAPSEEADLDALIAKAAGLSAARRPEFRILMHDCLMLAEGRYAYTTQAAFVNRVLAFT